MSELGTFVTVDVDPATNDGLSEAPALVTGVYDDGSLRLRVFGSNSEQDTYRNHVGDDGQPFPYDDQGANAPAVGGAPSAAPAPSPAPAMDAQTSAIATEVEQLTPEERAQLATALADYDAQHAAVETAPAAGSTDAPPPVL